MNAGFLQLCLKDNCKNACCELLAKYLSIGFYWGGLQSDVRREDCPPKFPDSGGKCCALM